MKTQNKTLNFDRKSNKTYLLIGISILIIQAVYHIMISAIFKV